MKHFGLLAVLAALMLSAPAAFAGDYDGTASTHQCDDKDGWGHP